MRGAWGGRILLVGDQATWRSRGSLATVVILPMRRIRASFLLRLAILGACLGLVVGVVLLGLHAGWVVGSIVFAAVLWFVGIELELLPWMIERAVVRRASQTRGPVESIWFVDLDAQRKSEVEAFHEDTSDNPTIR